MIFKELFYIFIAALQWLAMIVQVIVYSAVSLGLLAFAVCVACYLANKDEKE